MEDQAVILAQAVGPVDGISSYLLTQGVLGVACLTLAITVIYLYRDSRKKDLIIAELNKGWREDSKESERIVVQALNDNSQNYRILTEKIEVGRNERRN